MRYHSVIRDISVKNHVHVSVYMRCQQVLDHVSVFRMMLMSVCSRSEIKSKSDVGVKSAISVKTHMNNVNVNV